MTTKTHGGTKTYKYVGTDSDKFVTGNFYSYEDMSKLTGLSEHTLRSRMVKNKLKENGEKVITDLQLVPKRKPFTNLNEDQQEVKVRDSEALQGRTEEDGR